MEEDIRKQGMLYLQQQRFGKKWKRVWAVLYRESSCSISRLEFFECKDGGAERSDRSLRKQQEHKKVIRLADCIRVSELELDSSPRDSSAFLIETTEKTFVFAAERTQLDDWTHKLCETAFPMSWTEHSVKRGSLHRGSCVDEEEGMDNSLYSGRETVRDFRVCVRRTEASERCRLKGDGVLRADVDALHLIDKTGELLLSWPYRYLRRFGRDKSTFSFEAGRRCDSGEGSFEFDTKQGNFLFQAVEAAINLQRISPPHRQPSGGVQGVPDTPQDQNLPPSHSRLPSLPQSWTHIPQTSAAQAADGVYSMVSDAPTLQVTHAKEKESSTGAQQHRPLMSTLEPPVDKTLTGVKSLNLDTRPAPTPRKSQVKMISSCPLPSAAPEPGSAPFPGHAPTPSSRLSPKLGPGADQTYSQISLPGPTKARRGLASLHPPEPEYSLPFDTLTLPPSHHPPSPEAAADPLYDCIDETKIRNIFLSSAAATEKPEHIYDDPEGCSAGPLAPPSVYDDPEEVRGDAWRSRGTDNDPKGHEYPYNPRADDYAVPKRTQRRLPVSQSMSREAVGDGEEAQQEEAREEEEEEEEEEEQQHSPYNNVMVKMM